MTYHSTWKCCQVFLLGMVFVVLLLEGGCHENGNGVENGPSQGSSLPSNFVSPTVPSDIPGGASNATLTNAAIFAWQEFIALNWPAVQQTGALNTRDVPNQSKFFGDTSVPLVWHTYRSKVEIFPGTGSPPGYVDSPTQDYGYDHPPVYQYTETIPPCSGQAPPSQPAWINLDEISQIGLDQISAGVLRGVTPGHNTVPALIRFLAEANRPQYEYIASNDYWHQSSQYKTAIQNYTTAIAQSPPVQPTQPYINFPSGTIEVKAAWRQLATGEDASRFYVTNARYYEPQSSSSGQEACYYEDEWALIALHIIHKTPTAPYFVFATFEQTDNILTTTGLPVEDANGQVINQPSATNPTTPGLTYQDSPTDPSISIVGSSYCAAQDSRLNYQNLPQMKTGGFPTGGPICVNLRDNLIPDTIIDINTQAHQALAAYAEANGIQNSPWQFYKLINVQAKPFNQTDSDFNSLKPTYYQANSVVETDYTLQMFSGRIAGNGPPTDYSSTGAPDFQNVYVFEGTGSIQTWNMGGCMGCHGNAQLGGGDFSFITLGIGTTAPRVAEPDVPGLTTTKELGERYHYLFPR